MGLRSNRRIPVRGRRRDASPVARLLQLWALARGLSAIRDRRKRRRPGRRAALAGLLAGGAGAAIALAKSRRGGQDAGEPALSAQPAGGGQDAGDPALVAQPTGGEERTARDVGGPTSPTEGTGEAVAEDTTGGATGTRPAEPRLEPHE